MTTTTTTTTSAETITTFKTAMTKKLRQVRTGLLVKPMSHNFEKLFCTDVTLKRFQPLNDHMIGFGAKRTENSDQVMLIIS